MPPRLCPIRGVSVCLAMLLAGCGQLGAGGGAAGLGQSGEGVTSGVSGDGSGDKGVGSGLGEGGGMAMGGPNTIASTGGGSGGGQNGNAGAAASGNAATGGGNAANAGGNANANANANATVPKAATPAFALGAIIDYDGLGPHGTQSVQSFVAATGVVPTVVDSYVQLKTDGTFELALAQKLIDQAAAAKVPNVCLSVTCYVQGALPAAQLASLVSAVSYGKSKGVDIEIRFGYEMNGDWSPSNKTGTTTYAPANFLMQWAQVAPAVRAAGGKMFWSPNIPFNAGSALANWLPKDTSTIDMVGIDFYPKAGPLTAASVRTAINTIYPLAQQLKKPMYFGESAYASTGTSIQENATEAMSKMMWLSALTDAQLRRDFPMYKGFRWFDYQKFENNTYNNFSISADPFAAAALKTWYKTSVFMAK